MMIIMMNQWIQGYHRFRQPKMVILGYKPKCVIEATLCTDSANKIRDARDPENDTQPSHSISLIQGVLSCYVDLF